MQDTSSIATKIAKLLALSDRAGTPAEAATALAQAQTLITRHNISQEVIAAAEAQRNGAAVNEPIISRIVYVFPKTHSVLWIEWLAVCVAQCNQGAVRNGYADLGRKALKMHGTASDLAIMAALLPAIVGQIERLRDDWSKSSGNTGRTERDQYCRGAATTVIARLRATVQEARKAALAEAGQPAVRGDGAATPAPDAPVTTSTALVVASAIERLDKRARDAVAAMNVELGRPAERKAYATSRDVVKNSDARSAGKRDGHKVNIARTAAIGSGR